MISAIGLAFTFIPLTIAALMGVRQSDAGVASGLLNTTQQIGGAIGVAAASTIATTFTGHYVTSPRQPALSGPALTYGFQITFYVLAGVAALAAVLAAVMIEPKAAETVGRRRAGADARPGGRLMPSHELDAILLQIRTVALELRRLEGDGLDGLGLSSRRARSSRAWSRGWRNSSAATRHSPRAEPLYFSSFSSAFSASLPGSTPNFCWIIAACSSWSILSGSS